MTIGGALMIVLLKNFKYDKNGQLGFRKRRKVKIFVIKRPLRGEPIVHDAFWDFSPI